MRVLLEIRVIELTRRNLQTLLAQLDLDPADNLHAVSRQGWTVVAVENEVHYSDRPAGRMPRHIEAEISR